MKLQSLLVSAALLASTSVAHAIPVQVDFTATNFSAGSISSLSGSFVYEADAPNAAVQSLTSVALTINGYAYALGSLGFANYAGGQVLIGGLANGIGTIIGNSVDDFFFGFNRASSTFSYLAYGSFGQNVHGISSTGSVSVRPVAVPEPSALALLGIGLTAMLVSRRRKAAIR